MLAAAAHLEALPNRLSGSGSELLTEGIDGGEFPWDELPALVIALGHLRCFVRRCFQW